MTILPAAVHYDSWLDRLIAIETFHAFLCMGSLFAAVAFPFFAWRYFPFERGYFSGLFVTALCPFLGASLSAMIRVHHFLEYEEPGPGSYVIGRLSFPVQWAIYGIYASIAAVIIYSILYIVAQKRGHA